MPAQQADPCRPALCALGATPHAHCPCGLPMGASARLCDLCIAEGFRPRPLQATDHMEEWDGIRYPSLRRNRPTDVPHERYETFLAFVLGRVVRDQQPTTGEAA